MVSRARRDEGLLALARATVEAWEAPLDELGRELAMDRAIDALRIAVDRETTATHVAEHERHAAAAGENHWFTCPLCVDEEED